MKFVRSGGRRYVKLCESFRDGTGKSRQRVVANPGRLEALEAGSSSALINGLLRAAGKPTLDEGTGETEFAPGRSMGDTWLLTSLWQELGLDEAFRRILRRKRSFDAEHLLRVRVFYRLCDPESKLGILPWLEQTVVPDVDTDGVTHPRLLLSIDNIGIAPVYHRLPERIRAHALICFLALVLHHVLRMRLKAGASTVSPNRALEEIRQILLHKVMLHRRHAASGLTTLIPEQRHLFETIGLPAPSRLAL